MLGRRQGYCRAIFYPISVFGRPKCREHDGHEKNTEKCDLEGTDDDCVCTCKMTLRAVRFTYLPLQVEKLHRVAYPLLASMNLEERGRCPELLALLKRRGPCICYCLEKRSTFEIVLRFVRCLLLLCFLLVRGDG